MTYPDSVSLRNRFTLEHRGPKHVIAQDRGYGAFVEREVDGLRGTVSVATILLTNRECPWKCVFCDLWKNTLDERLPAGVIVEQIRSALRSLPEAQWIKLYNAGSFLDPHAIPQGDILAIVHLLAPFARVIVESHPALIDGKMGSRAIQLRDSIRQCGAESSTEVLKSQGPPRSINVPPSLEVAMGLETVHPFALERLNKGMTLDDFARAAEVLRTSDIDLRAFVLVQPPFIPPQESVHWALRSLDFARDQGARLVAFIPTRGGNGAMEALAASGDFTPPTLATLEEVLDRALESASSHGSPLVVADLWDLERFSDCPRCFPARAARLRRMNLSQKVEARVLCECASTKPSSERAC